MPDNASIHSFQEAIATHDALIAGSGIEIWVGAEPTFTDRHSEAPEWLIDALGESKEQRGRRVVVGLRRVFAGGVVLHTLGKQYPKEASLRWCYGYYHGRSGQPIWSGPPDPLLLEDNLRDDHNPDLWPDLAAGLQQRGWGVSSFTLSAFPTRRILMRPDGVSPPCNPQLDDRLARPFGDAVSQEHEGSRIVDASTTRLEVYLRSTRQERLAAWCLTADGFQVPLHQTHDQEGPARVCGLRYRRFKPWQGLHPTLNGHGPIQLVLSNKGYNSALKITLHEWRPQEGAYAGLPADLEKAHQRRRERCVVEILDKPPGEEPRSPNPYAVTPFCMDLRWL